MRLCLRTTARWFRTPSKFVAFRETKITSMPLDKNVPDFGVGIPQFKITYRLSEIGYTTTSSLYASNPKKSKENSDRRSPSQPHVHEGYCPAGLTSESDATVGSRAASNGVWVDSDVNGYSNVGESITFTFIVSNSGTKTLHEFCVTNSKLGAGCLTCSSPVVPPGESFSCAITYHVRVCTWWPIIMGGDVRLIDDATPNVVGVLICITHQLKDLSDPWVRM